MNIKEIKSKLEELEPFLQEKFKARTIGIFGSYVRGENKEGSDLDVLVDFEEGADLIHLVGLSLFLEEKLGMKVDVVPKRALREEIKESVLNEVIPL